MAAKTLSENVEQARDCQVTSKFKIIEERKSMCDKIGKIALAAIVWRVTNGSINARKFVVFLVPIKCYGKTEKTYSTISDFLSLYQRLNSTTNCKKLSVSSGGG